MPRLAHKGLLTLLGPEAASWTRWFLEVPGGGGLEDGVDSVSRIRDTG